MIRLQGVSKVFGDGRSRVPALNDITFSVEQGDFVVLHGASGAGKTTLLRMLYRAERVGSETAQRIARSLEQFVDLMAAQPAARIETLACVS